MSTNPVNNDFDITKWQRIMESELKLDEETKKLIETLCKDLLNSISSNREPFTSQKREITIEKSPSFPTTTPVPTNNRTPFTPLNRDEVKEILPSAAGFTVSTDEKPILATFECGESVALAGYEPTNGIAFIAHFITPDQIIEDGGILLYNITKLLKKEIKGPIQLHLRGGVKGRSEKTIDAIKLWMHRRHDLPMEIASENVLTDGSTENAKSISIDSRDGTVSLYYPLRRKANDIDVIRMIVYTSNSRIQLAYTPKN